MNIFYSATKNAFYDTSINPIDSIPEGSVEITREKHQELLIGQGEGKVITSDAEGFPILEDQPEMTEEELIAESNAEIIREIEALERDKQPRAMREFLIDGNKTRLEELNKEILALREKLV